MLVISNQEMSCGRSGDGRLIAGEWIVGNVVRRR